MVADRQLELPDMVTHHFGLDELPEAYHVFGDRSETGALKVVAGRTAGGAAGGAGARTDVA
jgi:alcohol dehydrogenase